jgi:hypothetical protein
MRVVKPDFWKSPKLANLTGDWEARLVLAGVWSYVEDNGVSLDNPTLIAAELFPFEDQTIVLPRVAVALDRLYHAGHIDRFKAEVEGTQLSLIGVCDWKDWQRPDKPSATRFPQSDRVSGKVPARPPRETRGSPESDSPPGDRSTELGDRSAESTARKRGTYVSSAHARKDDPDADYAEEYADWVAEEADEDWCTPEQRERYEALIDRQVRDGFDR